MNIRNIRQLKRFARERLENTPQEKRITLVFAGVTIGLSALVTVISFLLNLRIDQLGGLRNMSIRSILSTVQSVLPIAVSLFTMCVELGYVAAMLRTARGQYVSPNTLRLGFDRFWLLLRCTVIKSLLFLSLGMVSIYAGTMLFMFTPFFDQVSEIMMPLMSQSSILSGSFVVDDATYAQLLQAMLPAFAIIAVVFCAFAIPMLYSYRMSSYIIIDKPGTGAFAALRESKAMMRGNRKALLKLDVSLWWYYLAVMAANVLCYGDVITPMLGIEFPWSADASYFLFFALYLALMFALYFFLRGRLEVIYALAYDSIKPEENMDNSVVLGNIFQM